MIEEISTKEQFPDVSNDENLVWQSPRLRVNER